MVEAETGIILTVAGGGPGESGGDGGPATEAAVGNPNDVAVDSDGNLFIAELHNGKIRRVDGATGIITTVAGRDAFGFTGDGGPATEATLAGANSVIVDSKGNIRRLESSGFCLGMFPNVDYKLDQINLGVGDTTLLFTDGITESRNKNNEEFEEDRLIKLLKKNVKLGAEPLLEKIQKELDEFTEGTEQMDDQTIVIIKRTC